ncbi:hypothetical protein [Aestuariivita sp.]|jgi:hypothetical protein|uniref:hypothetical protein n=1 Tax=Aestuariivita sp. TaxID=1872407 RepID=UPI00216BD1CF|nr:hypothetical protein [Aestuariivita sp.]MCE8006208.1 hypothetical protein [Aestuariivita sp.]
MLPQDWIGPAIVAATIAALVTVLGWFVASKREVGRDRRRRRERERDVQTALRAEIQHYVDALSDPEYDPMVVWKDVVALMEADAEYVPMIPSERNDAVFQALIGDISILPEPVIGPVVRYYNQVFAIDALITDLRNDGFRALSQSQRIGLYTDYISLKLEARRMGNEATDGLSRSLANLNGVSSPGAARSDRS